MQMIIRTTRNINVHNKDATTHHNFPELEIFCIPHLTDIVEEYRKLRKVHSKSDFGKESLNF